MIKYGVYIHRSGKLKYLYERDGKMILDEGKRAKHYVFNVMYPVVVEMSIGWPIFETYLKNCEYLGDL